MQIFDRRQSEIVDGIEVRGRGAFRSCTREALEFLRLSPLFGAVRNYIPVIRQGRRSGMKAWAVKPTLTVDKATWRHSAVWYAGPLLTTPITLSFTATPKAETVEKNLIMMPGRASKPRSNASPFSVECL
jgi:hypothetical protein